MERQTTAGRLKVMELLPTIGAGGAEQLVLNLIRHLDRSRFDVLLVSMYSQEHTAEIYRNFSQEQGVRILYLNKKEGLDITTARRLSRLIQEERPDILHSHLYSVIYTLFSARKVPVRVHTIHTLAEKELPQYYQTIIKPAYRRKKIVPVGISGMVKQSICALYGLSPSETPEIDNGVDLRRFSPALKEATHGDSIRFICVARLYPEKNHRLLLDAFQRVQQRVPEAILRLVGDGDLRGEIEKQIQQLGLSNSVEMLGVRPDVETLLRESDVFILSSNYEGFGLVIAEAMATGLPIVSTKVGAAVDAVQNSINGILVDVGDVDALAEGMLRLAKDTSLRHRMAEAALTASKQFDIRIMVSRYEELFQELYAQNVR